MLVDKEILLKEMHCLVLLVENWKKMNGKDDVVLWDNVVVVVNIDAVDYFIISMGIIIRKVSKYMEEHILYKNGQ